MNSETTCPKCSSENIYPDQNTWICSECFFEWTPGQTKETETEVGLLIKDAHGNVLKDGDSVTVIKDLKVKGSSSSVKIGTKVKNIHLVESSDGHNIDCKIDGFGSMSLKSEFVKKS